MPRGKSLAILALPVLLLLVLLFLAQPELPFEVPLAREHERLALRDAAAAHGGQRKAAIGKHQSREEKLNQQLWRPFASAFTSASNSSAWSKTTISSHPSQEELEEKKAAWQTFLRLAPAYDTVSSLFRGYGIVICGGGFQLDYAFASISLLRENGCHLPIDLWVSSKRGEMPCVAVQQALHALGAVLYDIDLAVEHFETLDTQMYDEREKPYVLKQIALISSRCQFCLLLDADSIPTRDPTFLFRHKLFTESGLLLWPDFWGMLPGAYAIRTIFPRVGHDANIADEVSIESGQMVVDKSRAWRTLMVSAFMQVHTSYFDNLMRQLSHLGGGGDKQTFFFACVATNSSCSVVPHAVASGGFLAQGAYCGRTMIQHDPEGAVLFFHANMDKRRYSEAVREATRWNETLRRSDIIRTPNSPRSWSTQFLHEPRCPGGKWVVQINNEFKGTELRHVVQEYDLEQKLFLLIRRFHNIQCAGDSRA